MKNLDFNVGTNNMSCIYGNPIHTDKSFGHVLTTNLSIIKDRIPMGMDCAPLLANLSLLFYEYKYAKINLNLILEKLGCSDILLDTLTTCSH